MRGPRIALVAGEASGDTLGVHLIEALRERLPAVTFAGVAGPKMAQAGCTVLEPAESLAVMGLFEVVAHLPRLLRLRSRLEALWTRTPPDVYVGIDSPEFNLRLAARLRRHGIPTVQYVSPQVWAWRQGRVRKIAAAVDRVLCLLPFETQFYAEHRVEARFVGHPLADQIPMTTDPGPARTALGLDLTRPCLAILPGSRHGEVMRLGPDFAATVAWLASARPDLQFVAPMVNGALRTRFAEFLSRAGVADRVRLLDGQAQAAMAASDVVLLASGTATLEVTLVKRPMVVAYRLGRLTTFVLRNLGLYRSAYFAQPNLLAGRLLVPEYLNDDVTAERLGKAVLGQLSRPDYAELVQAFTTIHETLRRNASARAAEAVLELLHARSPAA